MEQLTENIPLIKTALELPVDVLRLVMNINIQGNQSAVTALGGDSLTTTCTTPIHTTCIGIHSDKQGPLDWANTLSREYGEWGITNLGTSNFAIIHNITLCHHHNVY